MRDAYVQVVAKRRAHKLRSILTMFGILWGVISVVVLSATGEGLQRGNLQVLEELGKNVVIVRGDLTTTQAGGARGPANHVDQGRRARTGARGAHGRRRERRD